MYRCLHGITIGLIEQWENINLILPKWTSNSVDLLRENRIASVPVRNIYTVFFDLESKYKPEPHNLVEELIISGLGILASALGLAKAFGIGPCVGVKP